MVTFHVLGPVQVVAGDGAEILLSGQRQRRLLCALLLHRNRIVSADRLAEMVWDTDVPVDAAALQSLVFRLRRRVPGLPLEYRAPGYLLTVDDDDVDVGRFERSVLDAVARRRDDPHGAAGLLDEALALWRGAPFDELVDADDAMIAARQVGEMRCRALEERFDLRLEFGEAAGAIADLEAFATREPLRERPQHLLISAYDVLGRRAEALRVYDAYRRRLADELGVAPSAELRLRHDRLLAADDVPVPPLRDEPPRSRGGVRRPTSSFVGRDDLVQDTIDRLVESRLITLIGPGGVGKTRVATEIAHRLAGTGIDGVVFCDLSTASERTVLDAVMGAAAVESRSDQPDLDRLVEVLRHERCCVVLDNCEHVLDAAAVVAERLVETTAHVVVLATSRERLAVDGERLVAVPPLTYEGGASSPATQLLVDRMASVTGRSPDLDELACLDELARRLDGLPLALELAAARLQTLTVREVLDGLDGSIAVLRGGRRTVDRHRSVDAALRWSYELLDEPSRATLSAAATFTAPFDPDDVAALMSLDRSTVADSLSLLVERSMAHRDGDHVALLHVVRSFAREQTAAEARARLATALSVRMRDVAVALRLEMRTASDTAPIDQYLTRVADFRRAIEIALADDDVGNALDIVISLRDLALSSSSFELTRWAEDAASAGERVDHPSTVDGYAVAAIGAWKRGALGDTRRFLAQAERLIDRGHAGPTYELLGAQATEDLAHGDLDRAIERLDAAMHLPGVRDDAIRYAETYGTLVICMAYAHRPDVVEAADEMAADLAHERSAVARAWCEYASGECRLDSDPALAREHLKRALEFARAGGSTFVEGIAGASLASLDVRAGDVPAAVTIYRWLVPLWLRAGLQSPFWTGMRSVTELLMRAGEPFVAARLLGAVTAPGSGHDVFGADAMRLEQVRARLVAELGDDSFDEAITQGATMDEAAAAMEAAAAFDRLFLAPP